MVKTKTQKNSLVIYDDNYTSPERWFDAFGNTVVKLSDTVGFPCDDTTLDPSEFVVTVTEAGAGDSTIINSAAAGEQLLLTTAATEYDGINAQTKGEAFKLDAANPLYFRADIKINDVDQTDLLIGLASTQTDLMNTSTSHAVNAEEFVGFVSIDAAATIAFQSFVGSAQTNSAVSEVSLADDTWAELEMYWDGEELSGYVNQTLVGTFTASLTTTDLTFSINFRTGETAADNLRLKNRKLIQLR